MRGGGQRVWMWGRWTPAMAIGGAVVALMALAAALPPALPGVASHAFRTIPAFPPLDFPSYTGDPRLEPLPQQPIEVGERAGWFNGVPVTLRFFPRPSVGDGGPDKNHADMYVFVYPDGRPVPQPPLLETVPKGATGAGRPVADLEAQIFSASWEVHVVRVQPGYVPGTIRFLCQLSDPQLVMDDVQTSILWNFPILPPQASVPNVEASGIKVETAFFEGERVRFAPYEIHDREHEVNSVYFFRDPAGNFRGAPVVPRIPGMPHYASFWEVQIVEVPADYVDNSLKSEAAVLSSGLAITSAGFQVNCPVVAVDGQRTHFRSLLEVMLDEHGRFDLLRFPLHMPSDPQPFHTHPGFDQRLFGFDLTFFVTELTGPVTSTGGPPPDASDAVRARCGTPETPGVGRVPPVGIITGSKQGLQTLIQDGAGHLIHVNQTDIDAGTVNVPLVGQALFEREFRRDEGRGPVGFQSSCAACHGIPVEGGHRISVVGGAGPRLRDLLPASDPPAVPLRRNTPHLFGAALLTQLGNERHRDPKDPTKRLPATDANAEPHNWKGTVKSLRDFTSIAFTGALGMNPTETVATRLGVSLAEAATRDFDHDGVANELSVGDITAIEVFQAMLPRPIRRDPTHPRVQSGQQVFAAIGCARCHTPVQMLENPTYQVTNPETKAVMTIPLGDRAVELYSDLKRHKMGSPLAEAAPQGGVPVDVFKTKELWGVGDTAPYLHDGGAPTLDAAIRMHGGAPRTDLTVAVDPPVPLGGARFALPIRITNRGAQPAAVQRLHLVAMQAPQGAAIEGADGPNGPGAVLHLSAVQAPGSVPPALLSGLAPGQTGILWAFVNRPAALPGAFAFRVFDDAGFSEAAAEAAAFDGLPPEQQADLLTFLEDLVLPVRHPFFLEAFIVAPKGGAPVAGVTEVRATAAAEAGVAGVWLTLDEGAPSFPMDFDPALGMWVIRWDSRSVVNGAHLLWVNITDREGLRQRSFIPIFVAN